MLRRLFGSDHSLAPAHLLYLSKFLKPSTLQQADYWDPVLGEAPEQAAKRFYDNGLLEQVGLSDRLAHAYTISELKPMLRERGLPVSGRKAVLINRLIEADPKGMQKTVRDLRLLVCTEKGKRIAEDYLAQEREKRARVVNQTLNALRENRFSEASEMVAGYEAQQVFMRGINIDWRNHNPRQDVAMLKVMFQARPKILPSLNEEHLGPLRLAAGMMYLWGEGHAKTWLPGNFKTDLDMDNDTAARMILFYAYHRRNMAGFRRLPMVKTVKISVTDTSCPRCKKLSAKKYKPPEVPELPYEHCTNALGCRCRAVLGDYDY
ncbi:MAG: SAP domain-containing protein [Candidatus Promineifilaceae bacterium]